MGTVGSAAQESFTEQAQAFLDSNYGTKAGFDSSKCSISDADSSGQFDAGDLSCNTEVPGGFIGPRAPVVGDQHTSFVMMSNRFNELTAVAANKGYTIPPARSSLKNGEPMSRLELKDDQGKLAGVLREQVSPPKKDKTITPSELEKVLSGDPDPDMSVDDYPAFVIKQEPGAP